MSNLVERLRSDAKKYREGTGAGVHEELDYQWSDKPHRHVYDLCRRLEEAADEIERLTAALAAAEKHIEELSEKVTEPNCACSYDRPGDVCMWHSPMLKKALADLAAAEVQAWNAAIEAAANLKYNTAEHIAHDMKIGMFPDRSDTAEYMSSAIRALRKETP